MVLGKGVCDILAWNAFLWAFSFPQALDPEYSLHERQLPKATIHSMDGGRPEMLLENMIQGNGVNSNCRSSHVHVRQV